MKRILIMMLGAIVALASCQKDAGLDGVGDGEMVDVTLSASVATASATRAEGDDFTAGDGTTVDRCILEVYTGDVLYKRMVTSVTDLTASFDLRLVSSQTYEFLLWADKGALETTDDSGDGVVGGGDTHYITTNTAGLKGITTSYADYVGNDETRDAFYYYEKMDIEASTAITAALTRPFGQVNVKTYLTDVPSDMYPASVKIEYTTTVGNTFDISTGSVSNDTEINWSASAAVIDGSDDAISSNYIDLSTDYLFASATEQDLHKFTIYFYSDEAGESEITSNENFVNIPVQRNYQTNISGELLTKQGAVNVEISSDFTEPNNDLTIADVESLTTMLAEDVAKADASYTIANEITTSSSVTIPSLTTEVSETSRSFDFSSGVADDAVLTIEEDTTDDYVAPAVVYITVPEDSSSQLDINLPNSTVYVNGDLYNLVAATSSATLVITEGTTVDGLTIKEGNVAVYGTLKGDVTLHADNVDSATTIVVYPTGSVSGATIDESITQVAISESDIEKYDVYMFADAAAFNTFMVDSAPTGDIMALITSTVSEDCTFEIPAGSSVGDVYINVLNIDNTNGITVTAKDMAQSEADAYTGKLSVKLASPIAGSNANLTIYVPYGDAGFSGYCGGLNVTSK